MTTWGIVTWAGGTKMATPHLFYFAIVLAALLFGMRGAVVAAAIAALLCAQVPIDTVSGEAQATAAMALRGVMFVTVAVVTSGALAVRRRVDQEMHFDELSEVINGGALPVAADPALSPLVADVLARRAFHTVFQPIYSLKTGALVSVEALTRFESEPYRSPDVWFAAAAEAGVGIALELAALEAALTAAASLPADVRLSINASPGTLADPRLHDLIRAVPGRLLTIELTEHAVIRDYDLLEEPLTILRAAGASIAVDDAGAGFSSLQHIVQVLPDVIKLDISLTQNLATSPVRRALGGALIDFVHGMGAVLVVEGVEESADLDAWARLGADAVQGYLVGRPGPLPLDRSSACVTAVLARPSLERALSRLEPAAQV